VAPWALLAVHGTLPALGTLSRHSAPPNAQTCQQCGETHGARPVGQVRRKSGWRPRFLPECFRWTDTARQKTNNGVLQWLTCQSTDCQRQPTSDRCVCGKSNRPAPDYVSGVVVKSFDVSNVMTHRDAWFRRIPHVDAMARHILYGGVFIPTTVGGIIPQTRRNLGSLEYDRP
jgi:hypothetical protein